MIAIITCSIDSIKLNTLKKSIDKTTTFPYQLIVIENTETKYSLCEAYNIGARQSNYNYLCFVHEDITFINKGWDQNLINHFSRNKISLLGVLGNTIKTKYPAGVYSSVQESNRIHHIQKFNDGSSISYYNNPENEVYSEVVTLDGMLLATKKEYWEKYPFDAERLNGFHGYDIDYSLKMRSLGKITVVYDIIIEHSSSGGNSIDWIESQVKVTNKWKNILPIRIPINDNGLLIRKTKDDLKQLTISSLKLNYKLSFSYKYGFLTILKFPLQRLNLFIIKHLIIQSLKCIKSFIFYQTK